MMNDEELDVLRRVIDRYSFDDLRQYRDSGKPSGHIAEAWSILGTYWKAPNVQRRPWSGTVGHMTARPVAEMPLVRLGKARAGPLVRDGGD